LAEVLPETHPGFVAGRFSSFAAYTELACQTSADEKQLLEEFRKDRLLAIKSILTFADQAFDFQWSWPDDHKAAGVLTREEIAAGTSYALAMLSNATGSRIDASGEFPFVQPDHHLAREWMLRCHALDELRQYEQFIFRLGFSCVRNADGSFSMFHPDADIEKALGIGYTQTCVERAVHARDKKGRRSPRRHR